MNSVHRSHAGEANASDEELLIRYRDHHDGDAFEALVRRYEKPLYNYLLRYLRSAPLAEEVFQATFLRLHEKCNLFTSDRKFRPWLYSIATHLAVDATRKEKPGMMQSLERELAATDNGGVSLLKMLASPTPSPLEQLEAQEQRAWVQHAVESLSESLRAALLLVYYQGLKYREAAEVLGVPVGTIKSRLHQAIATLHALWRREHPSYGGRILQTSNQD